MNRMKPKTARFGLAALALLLFGLVALAAIAQTPAEIARQKKLARQGKTAPTAPGSPAAAGKTPAAAAPRGVVPPGTSPLTRPAAGVVAPPPAAKPPGVTGTPGAPGAPGAPADQSVLPGGTPPPALGDIDQILEGEDELPSPATATPTTRATGATRSSRCSPPPTGRSSAVPDRRASRACSSTRSI